jgi:membrane associated rhomboid family serine protease
VIPSRTFPLLTISIIALNTIVFLYELTLSPRELTRLLATVGVVPAHFFWPTIVSAMFLHGGWTHFLGNMWFLWIFGENVEDRMGRVRYVVFYLLCGTVAALGQAWIDPNSTLPTIGASGAIAGVIGAYFVLYPNSRVLTLIPLIHIDVIEIPALFLLTFWFLMQLVSAGAIAATAHSQQGGIAFLAQLAGFLMGLVGVFVFRQRQPSNARWT